MNKYVDLLKKYRLIFTIIFVIITVFAILGVRQLEINADFDVFKVIDSDYQESLEQMNDVFGESTQTLLMVESDKINVESTINTVDKILADELGISYTSPLMLLDLSSGKSLKEKVSSLGELSPIIYQGDNAYITFMLSGDSDFAFDELYHALDQENMTYFLSGNPYMQYEVIALILTIVIFIPPLALGLLLLTFRSQLSSFKSAIMSVLPAGIAALWTMGLAGWFGGQLSIITVLAPVFAIIIGSADGLHFVSHMEDHVEEGNTNIQALKKTLKLVGMPMIITTTTSIAGFIGLMLINTDAIKDLAIFASIGILLAGIVTWYVLPLIFVGNIKVRAKKSHHYETLLKRLWGKPSIAIIAMILLVSAYFIPSISFEFNQLMFFKPSTNVQANFNKILDVNGGAIPLYYFGSIDMNQRDSAMKDIGSFLTQVEASEAVSKVMNPSAILGHQTPSMHMLSRAKDFIRLSNMKLYYRLMVFPNDLNNDTISHIQEDIEAIDTPLNGQLVGVQFLMRELNGQVIEGQLKSIFFTLALIILMLLISLRSFKLAFISCLPVIITSIVLYGFMGLTGISLNLMSATIYSISIGIGVDYAIHYVSIYKYYQTENHPNPREAALKFSQRPIIANAFGLALGMTALIISPLLLHQHVLTLMWVAMISSVLITLTLIPTLLKK